MAQVQNLLDLFRKGQDAQAADAKPAPRVAPRGGASGKNGRDAGALLPIAPAPAGGNQGVSPSPSSFHAKVEKSKAKLAAKERAPQAPEPAPRHAAPDRAAKPSEASQAPRKSARPATARNARPDDNDARAQARAGRSREDAGADQDRASAAQAADAAQTAQSGGERPGKGLDEKTVAKIKQGLEDLGVQVDDGQLNDPAFLMDMLRLLQSVPMQALPGADAEAGQAPAAIEAPADAGQVPAQAGAEAAPESGDPAQAAAPVLPEARENGTREAPKPIARKELARLLESRIAGLERAAQSPSGKAVGQAQPAGAPAREWPGAQARLQSEGPSTDPLPLADLDRLRVMQASALQNASAKGGAEAPRTGLVLESDSAEPSVEPASAAQAEAGPDASAARDQDVQGDLFGRDGDQAAGAGNPAAQPGAQSAKEGSAGVQFHHVLEQARSVEHRAGLPEGAAPRLPVHDAAVLDQIARRMSATAHKTGDEISIQLTPENLGKVRVSLEMKEEGMTARIAVENDSVRKQVESSLESLKDALKGQGIQLQGLEVSVDQRHSSLFNPDGSNAESFFRRQGREGGRGQGGREDGTAPLETAPESDTGRRWGYNTLEFIG